MNLEEHIDRMRKLGLRPHNSCDDSWYSCPKHPEGCANDDAGTDCNCGADAHNAEVEAAAKALSLALLGARPASPDSVITSIDAAIHTRAIACMQWASGLAIGVRGGWKTNDVQQVLSAAARGEDWERVRDELAARKGGKR